LTSRWRSSGKTLTELIGDAGLPVESVLRYGVQIAAALAHAHGRRIIHHDLKAPTSSSP
jgi:serine/threonine protein kinase